MPNVKIQLSNSFKENIRKELQGLIKKLSSLNILEDKEGQGQDRQDQLVGDIAVSAESNLRAGNAKIDGSRLASYIILDKSAKGIEVVFEAWDDKYLLTEIIADLNGNIKNHTQNINKQLEADKVIITGEDKAQYFFRLIKFEMDEGKSKITSDSVLKLVYNKDLNPVGRDEKGEMKQFNPNKTPTFQNNRAKLEKTSEEIIQNFVAQDQIAVDAKKVCEQKMKELESKFSQFCSQAEAIARKAKSKNPSQIF